MANTYKYILDFVANTDKFKSEVSSIKGMINTAATAAAGLFAVDKIFEFGSASVEAYNSSIQAETTLLTALKGRKDVQQGLIAQATELMGKTLFDDDEIVRAQSLVAAFVKEEGAIKRLMPAIMDFASAKQMDLASATDMVTRTMNGEMEALGRTGIKIHGAAGSAERLTSIITGLNDAYGGQAEAAAKVGTGALQILGNEFENLKETIGGFILSTQSQEGSFTKIIAKDVSDWSKIFEIWASDTVSTWQKTIASLSGSQMEKVWLSMDGGIHRLEQLKKDAEAAAKSYESLTGWMKTPTIDFGKPANSTKTYTNSIEGLNEKLKDYNAELLKIQPNDDAALRSKLAQILAIEQQIGKIDKLKAAMAAMYGPKITDPDYGKKVDPLQPKSIKSVGSTKNSEITALGNLGSSIDANTAKAKKFRAEIAKQKTDNIESLAASFGSLGNSIGGAAGSFLGMVGNILGMIPTLVAQIGALTTAEVSGSAAVTSAKSGEAMVSGVAASQKVPFPLNLIALAATMAAVGSAIFSVSKFADGGIAYGPTLGLMGEYPGARSNPEVIAPLSKLKAMIGGGGGESLILQPSLEFGYNSLRVRLNRVESNARKRTGKG